MFALAMLALAPMTSAIFFPFGGESSGGCDCTPSPVQAHQQQIPFCQQPPPPCPPPCPPPPPPCLCLPPLKLPTLSLSPPSLPTLPPLRFGCERKKRSTNVVHGESGISSDALCNNKEIRKIILKNLNLDPTLSKAAIHSELKANMGGEFVVICSEGNFSFVADSSEYCIDGSKSQTCYVLQI